MNLGQLIDPSWVQDGRRERFPRARHAEPESPAPPRPSGGRSRAILQILGNAVRPLYCRDVRLLLPAGLEALPVEQVGAYLSSLIEYGYAEKLGAERPFKYRITELGRARLR